MIRRRCGGRSCACAIPLSVTFAIVLMYFSGVTLNILSLSGLAIGVGMLVDNAIVVIENIYRLRGKGVPDLRGGSPGDLVARIVFEVPTRLTAKQRGLLEDLAKTLDPSNFPTAQSFGSKMKVFYQHRDKLQQKK